MHECFYQLLKTVRFATEVAIKCVTPQLPVVQCAPVESAIYSKATGTPVLVGSSNDVSFLMNAVHEVISVPLEYTGKSFRKLFPLVLTPMRTHGFHGLRKHNTAFHGIFVSQKKSAGQDKTILELLYAYEKKLA